VNSGYWNFVAISWSDSGDLHSNINGKHNHTSNFKQNFGLDMSDGGTWIIGGKITVGFFCYANCFNIYQLCLITHYYLKLAVIPFSRKLSFKVNNTLPVFVFTFEGLKNNSLVGKVAHVNLWFEVLPPPVLMALSRGISFVYASSGNGWTAFLLKNRHVGNVNKVKGVPYYLPGGFPNIYVSLISTLTLL
jgi:hypothetical protein